MNAKKILILAPHTDDGEFGCGGSISRFVNEKADVYYAAFSLAEESVPPPFPKNILESEVKGATQLLGIHNKNLLLYRYKVRHFAYQRQDILEDLVKLNRNLQPDLVFMPCLHDLHQDHSTIAAEGLRAFKKTSILGYEIPWNNMNFATQCFIPFSESDLKKKVAALNCYESQKNRNYLTDSFVTSLAVTRGTQIGKPYAEVFETIRWIL